jgi:hypothetical protein
MTTPFRVYGPYVVHRDMPFDNEWRKEFWSEIDDAVGAELSRAQGAYVYSLRNGSNYKPTYVGITKRLGFRAEVFNAQNNNKIAYHWRDQKGTIILHLLAKPKGVQKGFSKGINPDWLRSLEVLLIFMCRRKNRNLANKIHTTFLDGIGIDGITNVKKRLGKPHKAVSTLVNALDW